MVNIKKMKVSTAEKDLAFRNNLLWMLIAQALCILPLLIRLPAWIWVLWLFALLWRVQIHRARWRFPSFWLKLGLGLGAAGGIYLTYHGVVGVEPMIGFLVCSFVLKIIEMRSKKDALIVLFIGFVAVAAQFLFAQSILAGLYGLFSLFVLLAAWQALFISRTWTLKSHLVSAGLLLGQSIPFMLILFVVMPRLGPLWSVPAPQGQGHTGFSDELQLGDISELVRSPAVAFRASFTSAAPPTNDMYWRGLALDVFDGHTWRASDRFSAGTPVSFNRDPADFRYSIIIEPHHYRWLFTLGVPISAESAQLRLQHNQQDLLLSRQPVTSKSMYSVRSDKVGVPQGGLHANQKEALTMLPPIGNKRARDLAQDWVAQGLTEEAVVQEAMAMYARGYWYTLQPPPLGGDAIDDFLFSTRRGFCEHFASSFVFLMRAAGIPARLMVGYQGGEFNEVESYYIVRQSNAHAWAEVWLEGKGWQTVDPTAAVAPSRIEHGLEGALAQDERHLMRKSNWQNRMFGVLHRRFDALEYSWNRWVLNYNDDSQRGLLERLLGKNSPWRVGFVFTVLCALIFTGLALLNSASKKGKAASDQYRLLKPLLRKLERRGISRRPGETLGQLAVRVSDSHPQLARSLLEVDYWYGLVAYAENPNATARLKKAIQASQSHAFERAQRP